MMRMGWLELRSRGEFNMKITSAKFVKGIIGTNDILNDGIPQIAFVGRSNVGKSSLINALTNQNDLVKTGKKPGKTREINFFLINKDTYFVDLPGYGYARLEPSEREKIRKRMVWYLMESGAKPKFVVIVLDIKAGFTDYDEEMVGLLKMAGQNFIIVANKIDKLNKKETAHQLSLIKKGSGLSEGIYPCSAETKEGIDSLLEVLLG